MKKKATGRGKKKATTKKKGSKPKAKSQMQSDLAKIAEIGVMTLGALLPKSAMATIWRRELDEIRSRWLAGAQSLLTTDAVEIVKQRYGVDPTEATEVAQ